MKKTFVVMVMLFMACASSKINNDKGNVKGIESTWELNFISFSKITFDGLYPERKPTIKFEIKENKFSGNNSCNQYFGQLSLQGNKINFKDTKTAMTMMACQGKGDTEFMKALDKTDSFKVSSDGNTLTFLMGDVEIMKFTRVL